MKNKKLPSRIEFTTPLLDPIKNSKPCERSPRQRNANGRYLARKSPAQFRPLEFKMQVMAAGGICIGMLHFNQAFVRKQNIPL